MKKFLLMAFTLLFSVGMAHAQPQHKSQKKSMRTVQIRQQHRIAQGIHSGQLTPREAVRLQRQQGRIQHQKHKAFTDGRLTREEHRRIKNYQERASRQIYMKKHNGRQWQQEKLKSSSSQ